MVVGQLKNNQLIKQKSIDKKTRIEPPIIPKTSRIAELPSLRYGSIGSNKTVLGPLRLQNTCHCSSLKSNEVQVKKPTRNVRFKLPESSSDSSASLRKNFIAFVNSSDAGLRRDARRRVSTTKGDASYSKRNRCFCSITACRSHQTLCFNCCKVSENRSVYPRTFEELSACYRPSNTKRVLSDFSVINNKDESNIKIRKKNSKPDLCFTPPPQPPKTRVSILKPNEHCNNFHLKNQTPGKTTRKLNYSKHPKSFSPVPRLQNKNLEDTSNYESQRLLKPVRIKRKSNKSVKKNYREKPSVPVLVSVSPADGGRVHPTGFYIKGTLSPITSAVGLMSAPSPRGQALLQAAYEGDDEALHDLLKKALTDGIAPEELNSADHSGRTPLSYIVANGPVDVLLKILQLPGLNPNQPDNEGNTPLHFAAQAGQTECMNVLLTRCKKVIEIDARNNLGFTPLMKTALQGRSRCAKLLLLSGANPTLRDYGKGLRADQWARFCGRYLCADVIEKHARQRLLEKSTSYGNWGAENENGPTLVLSKQHQAPTPQQHVVTGLKHKLRKIFRTPSNSAVTSQRLITQLTSAALCASSPVLPTAPKIPPVVKSLIRPLSVPRLQITLVSNNNEDFNSNMDSELEMNKDVNKSEIDDKDRLDALDYESPDIDLKL